MTTLTDNTIPSTLEDEVVAFEMQPATISKLVRGYARSLAERLDAYGRDPAAGPVVRRSIDWLHPRSVWAARIGIGLPDQFEASRAGIADDLVQGEQERPWVEHFAAEAPREPWAEWAAANLEMHTGVVDPTVDIRFTEQPLEPIVERVNEAYGIIWRVWPQAALENHLLVRSIFYVEGGGFQSATFEDVFGAIMAGTLYVETLAGAFEMLLHEGGHHSLFLRNVFSTFVSNPADVVHHPLRPDPRPIKGALHAAHALSRMSTGLVRWCAAGDAPEEAFVRRDNCSASYRAVLATLAEHAHWTPAGERYFANMQKVADALPHPGDRAEPGWE